MHFAARYLYAAALTAALLPATLRKLSRNGFGGLHVAERLAQAPLPDTRPLWINAASVGELSAVALALKPLREQYPNLPLAFTYSAEAARALAPTRLGVPAHTLPLDYQGVMRRWFQRLRPRLCLLVEQELWPNLILEAQHAQVPVAVINGRLSARSARRHARLHTLTRNLFTNLKLVVAQDRASARRFALLGAPHVIISGNTKFDAQADATQIAAGKHLRKLLQAAHPGKQIVLAASTRITSQGLSEEHLLLDALGKDLRGLVLLLVPRHPERFADVATLLQQRNIAFMRKTQLANANLPACLLGDTMGEMDSYIAAADSVFIGASLIDLGGQNPMEAFTQGKPVIMGRYTQNFSQLVSQATRAQAMLTANDAIAVANALTGPLADANTRATMGRAGLQLAAQARGATQRTLTALAPLLASSGLTQPITR